jgi:hypothetical protein
MQATLLELDEFYDFFIKKELPCLYYLNNRFILEFRLFKAWDFDFQGTVFRFMDQAYFEITDRQVEKFLEERIEENNNFSGLEIILNESLGQEICKELALEQFLNDEKYTSFGLLGNGALVDFYVNSYKWQDGEFFNRPYPYWCNDCRCVLLSQQRYELPRKIVVNVFYRFFREKNKQSLFSKLLVFLDKEEILEKLYPIVGNSNIGLDEIFSFPFLKREKIRFLI